MIASLKFPGTALPRPQGQRRVRASLASIRWLERHHTSPQDRGDVLRGFDEKVHAQHTEARSDDDGKSKRKMETSESEDGKETRTPNSGVLDSFTGEEGTLDLDLDSWITREAQEGGWSPYGVRTSSQSKWRFTWNPNDAVRPYRRTDFTMQDWSDHRSLSRYVSNIFNLPMSGIFRALLVPMILLTAEAAVYYLLTLGAAKGTLPQWMPQQLPQIGMKPFELTAFALALLLGFRTNISYQRWTAACNIISQVTAGCRTIARLCMVHVSSERRAIRACTWIKAFVVCLLYRMREDKDVEQALWKIGLPVSSATRVVKAGNPSVYCLQELSAAVKGNMDDTSRSILEIGIMDLDKLTTAADTLIRSPVPLFYTQHVARFITVWLGMLPFALVGCLGWQAIPAMTIISFALLGIDEIGLQIEEPFGILPLETMVGTVSTDVDTMARGRAARKLAAIGTSLAPV